MPNAGRANKRLPTCWQKTGLGQKDVRHAEIERHIVNPGQASCAYKVGMLKVQELRERAPSVRQQIHDRNA